MSDEFDAESLFDDDYLYFYAPLLDEARSDAEAARIQALGPVTAGDHVLDLACGHGRITRRLAAAGARMTGIDVTADFLAQARAEAAQVGHEIDYRQADMRDLAEEAAYDVVLLWFTSFGYFDDVTNRNVLAAVRRALRPAGRLLLELNHGPGLWAGYLPASAQRVGDDVMLDEYRYDPLTGRSHDRRTVVRGGRVRSFRFSNRLFTFTELRDWLLDAGFVSVDGYGLTGEPLRHHDRRMLLRAVAPG